LRNAYRGYNSRMKRLKSRYYSLRRQERRDIRAYKSLVRRRRSGRTRGSWRAAPPKHRQRGYAPPTARRTSRNPCVARYYTVAFHKDCTPGGRYSIDRVKCLCHPPKASRPKKCRTIRHKFSDYIVRCPKTGQIRRKVKRCKCLYRGIY
jgi:hypothetical protein